MKVKLFAIAIVLIVIALWLSLPAFSEDIGPAHNQTRVEDIPEWKQNQLYLSFFLLFTAIGVVVYGKHLENKEEERLARPRKVNEKNE